MIRFACLDFENLVEAICNDHNWIKPRIVFQVCGVDFGYEGVLHLNQSEGYSNSGALMEHLGIILGQMNGMSQGVSEEYFGLQREIWESRN